MTGFRSALAFLTSLGGHHPPSPDALPWFPAIGLAVGAASAGAWWAADGPLGPLVAAAVALAVDLWLTGFLHFDGLADSADGLLPPHSDPERRLDVMARPDVGAFGVTAVVLVLITRWAAFVQLDPSGAAIMAVALLWGISRLAMAVLVMTDGYVRPGGLAQAFSGARRLPVGVSAVAFLAVLPVVAAAIDRDMATPAGGFALAAFVAVVVLAHRRIGGFTGDVVGAAGVVAETVGLAVLAAP